MGVAWHRMAVVRIKVSSTRVEEDSCSCMDRWILVRLRALGEENTSAFLRVPAPTQVALIQECSIRSPRQPILVPITSHPR